MRQLLVMASATLHLMNWSDPTNGNAVPRGVALRDGVYPPQGVTAASIPVRGG